MRAVPDQVARFVQRPFTSLGTDGFGHSDSREALRRHFEIDAPHIVVAVLSALADQGSIPASTVKEAITRYAIDTDAPTPF
jgi:pyruvate dehydrogenase E1 component